CFNPIADAAQSPRLSVDSTRSLGSFSFPGVLKAHHLMEAGPQSVISDLATDAETSVGQGSGVAVRSGPRNDSYIYISQQKAPGILTPELDIASDRDNQEIQYIYHHQKYASMRFYISERERARPLDYRAETADSCFTTCANCKVSIYMKFLEKAKQQRQGSWTVVNPVQLNDNVNFYKNVKFKNYRLVGSSSKPTPIEQIQKTSVSGSKRVRWNTLREKMMTEVSLAPLQDPDLTPKP
uniref:Uncharacterized protein n=1 Tax=Sus scrofa TaxID=9823 RepID=A0A8D1ENZ5_PIG